MPQADEFVAGRLRLAERFHDHVEIKRVGAPLVERRIHGPIVQTDTELREVACKRRDNALEALLYRDQHDLELQALALAVLQHAILARPAGRSPDVARAPQVGAQAARAQ